MTFLLGICPWLVLGACAAVLLWEGAAGHRLQRAAERARSLTSRSAVEALTLAEYAELDALDALCGPVFEPSEWWPLCACSLCGRRLAEGDPITVQPSVTVGWASGGWVTEEPLCRECGVAVGSVA